MNAKFRLYKVGVLLFVIIFTVRCGGLDYGSVTDIDGNLYKTIEIGSQVWMAENLNVSRYRNGDTILNYIDSASWNQATTGAWCYYDNDIANGSVWGRLYNGYAMLDPRGICPDGWHVPTTEEWAELKMNTGGENSARHLMLDDPQYWSWYDQINPDNETGFSAFPTGIRSLSGFFLQKTHADFWTNSIDTATFDQFCWHLLYNSPSTFFFNDAVSQNYGQSCRCIQD